MSSVLAHGLTKDNIEIAVRVRKPVDNGQGARLEDDSGPATGFEAVNLSGDTSYASGQEPRAIWVGTGGDVKVDGLDRTGAPVTGVTFKNAANGTTLPLARVSKIYGTSNGTTAADLVSLW